MFHDLEVCRTVTPDGVAIVCLLADSLLDSTIVVDLSKQEPAVPQAVAPKCPTWGPVLGQA
jgi:hypothetical protein